MPLTIVAALTVAALCHPQGPATAQEPVSLRHALEPGTSFGFVIDVDARIEFDAPEQRQDSRMRFCMHFSAEVGAVERGHAKVACHLDRIEANVVSPAARGDFDSARREDQGPLSQLAQLAGQVFEVRVDGAGHIAGVESPPALRALARERLGADFDTLFAAWFVPLPRGPVAPGAEWPAEIALADPTAAGAHAIKATDRLADVALGHAHIDRTLQLEPPPARPGVRFEPGKGTGRIVFDVAAGRVESAELELSARAVRTDGAAKAPAAGTSTLRVRATAAGRAEHPAAHEPDPRPNR